MNEKGTVLLGSRKIPNWCPIALSVFALAGAAFADNQVEEARFTVRDEVVAKGVEPFTATIGGFGNGAFFPGGGFEPLVFRNMFRTTQGAENIVIASRNTLTKHESWRDGFLDSGEVEVLRIENGAFRSVRQDGIAPGGYRTAGWVKLFGKKIVSPMHSSVEVALPHYSRTDVPYYFTLRAVDRNGAVSDPAEPVSITVPAREKGTKPDNALIEDTPDQDRSSRLSKPSGLSAELTDKGFVRLSWEPVAGATGYAIYRSDSPPESHVQPHIELEGDGPALLAGDLVILRARLLSSERETMVANRVWNAGEPKTELLPYLVKQWPDDPNGAAWTLVPHEPDTPVEDAGDTYLRVSLDPGEVFRVGRANHSGTGQSWYEVLKAGKEYRFEMWIRGETENPAIFQLDGFHSKKAGGPIGPFVFDVTPRWEKVTGSFTPPVTFDGVRANRMDLVFSGPGTVDIDNFRVYRSDAPYLSLLPEDFERLKTSGMSALRTHGFIKTGWTSYDLDQLTNPAGATTVGRGNTLPQVLGEIARLDMDPWLQIEPHLSAEDWLGLAEFLAAPFDPEKDDPAAMPWAAKRVAQGREAPWIDSFDRVFFEIGNETWNRLFRPWVFEPMRDAATGKRYSPGEVYGLYQEYVLDILRQSPHWGRLQPKLVPVIGGRAGAGDWHGFEFGPDAARMSPGTSVLAHAGYTGGWEQGAGPARPTPESLSWVLTRVLQSAIPLAVKQVAQAREIATKNGIELSAGIYEAGPGFVLNGLNGRKVTEEEKEDQEQAMKSAAAGTATLDSFLARARAGMTLQNFFRYSSNENWASHRRWYKGGQALPSWDLLALFNQTATGDMLAVETDQSPVMDLPKSRNLDPVIGGPLVAAYATRAGDRVTVMLISRRVPFYPDPTDDGVSVVTVDLPFATAERVTRFSQTGAWNSHNLESREVEIRSEEVDPATFLPRLNHPALQPGMSVFYVFEGVQ